MEKFKSCEELDMAVNEYSAGMYLARGALGKIVNELKKNNVNLESINYAKEKLDVLKFDQKDFQKWILENIKEESICSEQVDS